MKGGVAVQLSVHIGANVNCPGGEVQVQGFKLTLELVLGVVLRGKIRAPIAHPVFDPEVAAKEFVAVPGPVVIGQVGIDIETQGSVFGNRTSEWAVFQRIGPPEEKVAVVTTVEVEVDSQS